VAPSSQEAIIPPPSSLPKDWALAVTSLSKLLSWKEQDRNNLRGPGNEKMGGEREDNRQTRLNDKFASSRGVSMYDRFICGGAVVAAHRGSAVSLTMLPFGGRGWFLTFVGRALHHGLSVADVRSVAKIKELKRAHHQQKSPK